VVRCQRLQIICWWRETSTIYLSITSSNMGSGWR